MSRPGELQRARGRSQVPLLRQLIPPPADRCPYCGSRDLAIRAVDLKLCAECGRLSRGGRTLTEQGKAPARGSPGFPATGALTVVAGDPGREEHHVTPTMQTDIAIRDEALEPLIERFHQMEDQIRDAVELRGWLVNGSSWVPAVGDNVSKPVGDAVPLFALRSEGLADSLTNANAGTGRTPASGG